MKYLRCYLGLSIIFIVPCTLYTFVKELYQLQQSLHTLTQFLSERQKIVKPKITTYEDLKQIVDQAYTIKNTTLLDGYEQTIAVVTAQYLLEELIKEGPLPENRPEYIPLIAYVIQKTVEQYPDKNMNLRCASLAAGDLENEFLLIRALRYVGYKTIDLAAIDIKYRAEEKEEISRKFKDWCDKRNIYDVNVILFEGAYDYIDNVVDNKLPKNNLFLMIQPGGSLGIHYYKDPVSGNEGVNVLGFYENLKNDSPYIKIYFPYEPSDIFINADFAGKEKAIATFKNIIEQSKYVKLGRKGAWWFYLNQLINSLISENRNNFHIPYIVIGPDLDILFYDLIRYTALDSKKFLAFTTLNLCMTQVTDMSGSLQDIYNRYKKA